MDVGKMMEQKRDSSQEVTVHWYWGPTGTGKTRKALWEATEKYGDGVYIKSTNSKWFDGYDGQKAVVFDDLRSSWFEYAYLLKLLDRYPTQVELKGGSRQFRATEIWVTSPFPPNEMYQKMQETDDGKRDLIDQLLRRVTHTVHMPMTPFGSWVPPVTEGVATVDEVDDEEVKKKMRVLDEQAWREENPPALVEVGTVWEEAEKARVQNGVDRAYDCVGSPVLQDRLQVWKATMNLPPLQTGREGLCNYVDTPTRMSVKLEPFSPIPRI